MKQSNPHPESFRVAVLDMNLGIEDIRPQSQQPQYAVHVTAPGPSPFVIGGKLLENGSFGGSHVYLGKSGFLRHGGRAVLGNAKQMKSVIDQLKQSPLCKGFTILEVPQCPMN